MHLFSTSTFFIRYEGTILYFLNSCHSSHFLRTESLASLILRSCHHPRWPPNIHVKDTFHTTQPPHTSLIFKKSYYLNYHQSFDINGHGWPPRRLNSNILLWLKSHSNGWVPCHLLFDLKRPPQCLKPFLFCSFPSLSSQDLRAHCSALTVSSSPCLPNTVSALCSLQLWISLQIFKL